MTNIGTSDGGEDEEDARRQFEARFGFPYPAQRGAREYLRATLPPVPPPLPRAASAKRVACLVFATVAVLNTHVHIICPTLRAVVAVFCLVKAWRLSRRRPPAPGPTPIADRWGGPPGFCARMLLTLLTSLAVLKTPALFTNAAFNEEFFGTETSRLDLAFGRTAVIQRFKTGPWVVNEDDVVVSIRYHLFNLVGVEHEVARCHPWADTGLSADGESVILQDDDGYRRISRW